MSVLLLLPLTMLLSLLYPIMSHLSLATVLLLFFPLQCCYCYFPQQTVSLIGALRPHRQIRDLSQRSAIAGVRAAFAQLPPKELMFQPRRKTQPQAIGCLIRPVFAKPYCFFFFFLAPLTLFFASVDSPSIHFCDGSTVKKKYRSAYLKWRFKS